MGMVGNFLVYFLRQERIFKNLNKQSNKKENAVITALQENIMVAIHKTLKLAEITENISVEVEGQNELQKRETQSLT